MESLRSHSKCFPHSEGSRPRPTVHNEREHLCLLPEKLLAYSECNLIESASDRIILVAHARRPDKHRLLSRLLAIFADSFDKHRPLSGSSTEHALCHSPFLNHGSKPVQCWENTVLQGDGRRNEEGKVQRHIVRGHGNLCLLKDKKKTSSPCTTKARTSSAAISYGVDNVYHWVCNLLTDQLRYSLALSYRICIGA